MERELSDRVSVSSNRSGVVRALFERFNAQDVEGAVELLDAHVWTADRFSLEPPTRGHSAFRKLWMRRSRLAPSTVRVHQVVELDSAVEAVVAYHVRPALGDVPPPVHVVHRFSFKGERIASIEGTLIGDLPNSIKELLTK